MNDAAFWHRLQFAVTATYHYLFPQLTMGLAWFIVFWKWRGLRTGQERYFEAARLWSRNERSEVLARRLWPVVFASLVVISAETWYVRPELFAGIVRRPSAWLALAIVLGGAVALFSGIRRRQESLACVGSCLFIAGLVTGAAAALFPILLFSTLASKYSLTAFNSAVSAEGLSVAMIWWPIALVLSLTYAGFIFRHYHGEVAPRRDSHGLYGV
jgi:cytochrome bd-type quinol oxidase subunit 2